MPGLLLAGKGGKADGTQVARIACGLVTFKFETNESLPALPPDTGIDRLSCGNLWENIRVVRFDVERKNLWTSIKPINLLNVLKACNRKGRETNDRQSLSF